MKIPATYAAITLGQYVRWATAHDAISRCAAALDTDQSIVRKLKPESIAKINTLFQVVVETETTIHAKTMKLNGNEYGFFPDIEAISLGEYADLDELSKNVFGPSKDIASLVTMMAICYRKVTSKMGTGYAIQDYTASVVDQNRKDIEQLPMSVVSGALLFFSTFEIELLKSSQDYLMEVLNNLQTDLQSTSTNGDGSISLNHLQTKTH